MKLIFGKDAAKELGVSAWFVCSMKKAGAPFWGNKTDLTELENWMRANPGFIANRQWRRKARGSKARVRQLLR